MIKTAVDRKDKYASQNWVPKTRSQSYDKQEEIAEESAEIPGRPSNE